MPATPDQLAQFARQNYLNLETYRRNGQAVRTPVWFAEDGGVFYIYSLGDAGKIKRIRRNPRVRVVPCSFNGALLGAWVEGNARILAGVEASRGDTLLDKKYGWQRKLGNLWRRIMPKEQAVVAIELE